LKKKSNLFSRLHHPDKLNWNKPWTWAILIRVKKRVDDMQEKEEGRFMVFSATFNNISAISCRLALLMEETRVLGENHRSTISHWQTLNFNIYTCHTYWIWSMVLFSVGAISSRSGSSQNKYKTGTMKQNISEKNITIIIYLWQEYLGNIYFGLVDCM
jgi:hypothetical protein